MRFRRAAGQEAARKRGDAVCLSVQDTRLGCLFALPPDGVVKVGLLELPAFPTLKLFSSSIVENPYLGSQRHNNSCLYRHK